MDLLTVFVDACLIIVFLVCLLGIVFTVFIHRKRQVCSHVPGPVAPSFVFGHAPIFMKSWTETGQTSSLLYDWAMKYGDTFRLMFVYNPMIVTSDPEAVKELLVSGGHPKAKQTLERIAYLYGARFLGQGLVTDADHERWSSRRTVLNPAFHKKYLKAMMTEFNSCGDDMVDNLSECADGKSVVALIPILHRITLDVIGKVAFNQDIDSIHNADSPFPTAISKLMLGFSTSVWDVFWFLKPWENKEFKNEVRSSCKFLRKTCLEWLEERKSVMARGEGVPDDMLTLVIKAHETHESMQDIETIMDDFLTLFVAGQETTANAVAFALMEIGRDPEVWEKLKSEVDDVLGTKGEITYEDLGKLEYTGMIFKESLRLYPPAPLTFRELSRDTNIGGYMIPKGTIVQVNMFISGRNPKYWKDPLKFEPERFRKDGEASHCTYNYIPFSMGPRNCIGQNMAQMEAKILLAKFVQKFNFELDPNQSFGIAEATTLRPKDGVKCTLTSRSEE